MDKITVELVRSMQGIEGFPCGSEEKMCEISQAPRYTACPNPYISSFLEMHGEKYDSEKDEYKRAPYSSDVAEDKHDLIYNIHSYHTKVPPKAIKAFIEHYTEPGDIVLDSFCGTGMTGIAAKICDDKGIGKSQRHAILSDLSTIAAFVAGNYNHSIDDDTILRIEQSLEAIKRKYYTLYETKHIEDGIAVKDLTGRNIMGDINYTVWSDVLICPNCSTEFVYYDEAVDKTTNKTRKEFSCPHCGLKLSKAKCVRAVVVEEDPITNEVMEVTKSVPVLINYSVGKTRYNKTPDEDDLKKIKELSIDYLKLPNRDIVFPKGDKTPEMFRGNIKYVWQVYKSRTLFMIEKYLEVCDKNKGMFLLTSALPKLTILNRFMPEHGSRALVGPMAGTYYLPALYVENNVIKQLEFQFKKLCNLKYYDTDTIISTQSAIDLRQIPDNIVDYVFVDPPFGANIMYSELNILSESWLGVLTNNNSEAIMNNTQRKTLVEYQELMVKAFSELNRVLKPNRWITIEFHNSKNSVWNSIQEAINRAGFVIADVRTLNKEKKTINQFNARGAVDQDLVISAYKPKDKFKRVFLEDAGSEESAWDFVRQHLENLPIAPISNGKIEIVSERQNVLLFDRMVAYHIMNGLPVPISATDFYHKLDELFLKRDGMYFLANQVNEYDVIRLKTDIEPVQLSFIVTNEKTAISWLYQQLSDEYGGPKLYSDIQPIFMREIKMVDKYEHIPELQTILEENFIQNENGMWYVPDITKEGDIAKLREKKLLKEFEGYLQSKGKLKLFRSEAIRVGFSKLWKDKNYKAIVDLAERLPEQTIQEDQNLLMYYDISLSRI